MGIEKAPGEYITEMTEPTGWPDIDEDLLTKRATDLTTKSTQLLWVLEKWETQHSELTSGSVWSGSAADAGTGAVKSRIAQMHSLRNHLEGHCLVHNGRTNCG